MSFVPVAVKQGPRWVMVDTLLYPANKTEIARLTLAEMQVWYAAQDPQVLVESNSDFHQFWYWHYIVPLKLKRFLYSFKFW